MERYGISGIAVGGTGTGYGSNQIVKMKCKFTDSKQIYEIFKFIAQFTEDVNLVCAEDGISIFTMSSCHTVFIDAKMPPSYFQEYECTESCLIGLRVPILLNALTKGKCELSMQNVGDNVLFTRTTSDESVKYLIKQVNIEENNLQIPPLEENVTMTVQYSVLKKWKKSILDFTKSSVTIRPMTDSVHVSSKGDGGAVATEQSICKDLQYLVFKEPSPMELGNTLLNRGMMIGEVHPVVEIGYQNGMPFRIGVKLNEKDAHLQVFIAPKYSEEE